MIIFSPASYGEVDLRKTIVITSGIVVLSGVLYLLAITCLLHSHWFVNGIGLLLLVQSLLWFAYLVHECFHGNSYPSRKANRMLGELGLFVTGSGYGRYRELQICHLTHHRNRADFCRLCLPEFLRSCPQWGQMLLLTLEWLYIPAVNLLLRWRIILAPFVNERRRNDRGRVALVLLVRGSGFAILGLFSLRSLALYWVGYLCFLTLMRFMDAFQHTYEVYQFDEEMPKLSQHYEQRHTYSIVSKYALLNLIFLNFGYHSAHHQKMGTPWYLLPELEGRLNPQQIEIFSLIKNYHRFRRARLMKGQGETVVEGEEINVAHFIGAGEASFLIFPE